MTKRLNNIKTAMVLIETGNKGDVSLCLAQRIADEVIMLGLEPVESEEAISAGAKTARQIRKRLLSLSNSTTRYKSTVIVSAKPWQDVFHVISQEKPDLLLVEWQNGKYLSGIPITELLANSPCDLAIVRKGKTIDFKRILIAMRGGPYAELAFELGLNLSANQIDVLHMALTGALNDAPFKGLKHILKQIPEVNLRTIQTEDVLKSIMEESQAYDLVIVGASGSNSLAGSPIGVVAERLMDASPATVVVVKTHQPITDIAFDESAGAQAISILVDKWFAENTFHADEFADLKQLLELKQKQGITISLALPALNEEKTVGKVISTIKNALMDKFPLLDEIVLVDSNSSDQTRAIAENLGIPVFIHQNILPELGSRSGKGEALWKSLLVTRGDLIAWIDTDILNIHPRFVYGVIGPLLLNPKIQLVKGFYRRPLKVGNKTQAGGGGRVTELTARPLLNLFYPELSGVVQPLSGEYAGRRTALEKATFFSGYGVETGLLIDVLEQHGLRAIAQVDLLERIHRNQELEALSKMSFAIIQTVLRKLERRYERAMIEDVNKTMKLIRYANGGYFLDVEEIAERERQPMVTIPAYLERGKE